MKYPDFPSINIFLASVPNGKKPKGEAVMGSILSEMKIDLKKEEVISIKELAPYSCEFPTMPDEL